MRPDDQTIDEAARQLRARLETMLEQLPEDDPSYMPVKTREDTRRRWAQAAKVEDSSRPRPVRKRVAGKTAAVLDTEIDLSSIGVWLDLGQDRARDDD